MGISDPKKETHWRQATRDELRLQNSEQSVLRRSHCLGRTNVSGKARAYRVYRRVRGCSPNAGSPKPSEVSTTFVRVYWNDTMRQLWFTGDGRTQGQSVWIPICLLSLFEATPRRKVLGAVGR